MARYGAGAKKTVGSAMRRRKRGTLKSGSRHKVTSRKQAIAIGLNEAREKGAKVPEPRRGGGKRTSSRKPSASRKKSASRKRSSTRRRSSPRKHK